jgi:LCP family protein required for cell wall assembly
VFEHLDDPRPPALGAGLRRRVARGAQRRRRRRTAGGVGAVLVASVAGTGGLYARALWPARDIERVEVAGTDSVPHGRPVTVLLLGTDGRSGVGSHNFDTIVLARVDPGAGTASLLSLPRDLIVDVPGEGPAMINSPTDPAAVVAIVEEQIGIPVDHLAVVGLDGVREMVDRMGGVDVRVPAPVRDEASGLFLDRTGCVTLGGEQALALLRSRKLEVLGSDGSWHRDPLSDLGRVERQRQVLFGALAGLGAGGFAPGDLEDDVRWLAAHVTVDADLSVAGMVELARAVVRLGPDDVSGATIPVVTSPLDPNRLALDAAAAPATIAAFVAGDPLPPTPPVTPGAPGVAAPDDPFSTAIGTC